MKFGYTIVYVKSVVDTLAFYKKAFGFETRFVDESGQFGELETGATTIAFASHQLAEMTIGDSYIKANPDSKPLGMELAFLTNNVPAAYSKALAAGAISIAAPAEKPWGQIVAYVRDNEGILVEICTPMGG